MVKTDTENAVEDGRCLQQQVLALNDPHVEPSALGLSQNYADVDSRGQEAGIGEVSTDEVARPSGNMRGAKSGRVLPHVKPPQRLYHFTSIFALPGIVREGISNGEVAVTPVHVVNFPWFTSDFAVEAQTDWVCDSQHKLALRLEVEFHRGDECLVRWRDYANQLRVRDDWCPSHDWSTD